MPGRSDQTSGAGVAVPIDALLSLVPDAALVVDSNGTIVDCNENAERLFKVEKGGLRGRAVEELVPERFRDQHRDHRAGYQKEPSARPMGTGLDLFAVRANGEEFPVDISLAPVRTESGVMTIALVRDLSVFLTQVVAEQKTIGARAMASEKDRIARDLHDRVIQRIFAAGMALQGLAGRIVDKTAKSRVLEVIDELDTTIREIRSSIFELESRPVERFGAGSSLRERILIEATRAEEGLGFAPSVRFAGPIDVTVGGALADDVVAVVREALSNVAKYAHATRTEVSISVGSDHSGQEVEVVVIDDGIGIGRVRRSSGLANLQERAKARNGSFSVAKQPEGGTRLDWRVPVP